MALPRFNDERDPLDPRTRGRPVRHVLLEDDEAPATAPAAVLTPPPRVPPGIAATDSCPDPDPDPEGSTPHFLTSFPMPEYITFQPATFAIVIVMLILVVVAGLLAVAGSFP